MYCRTCGNKMNDSALSCVECGTKKGFGTKYCTNCGANTTINTGFCRSCGAKQKNVMSAKEKKDKFTELQNKAKKTRKIKNILEIAVWGIIIITLVLILVLIFRPQPDNIPAPPDSSSLSPNAFIHDELKRVGNTYYYDSDISKDVVEYWIQSRYIISYIIMSIIFFICTFINLLFINYSYKKILKQMEEMKRCIVERVVTK